MTFTPGGRWRSLRCAVRGVGELLRTQHNAWLHAIATGLVLAAGLSVGLSRLEWCAIVLAMMAVWTAEAVNTAIEIAVDVASPAADPLAGRAKDIAAGAVLISACGAVIVGTLVFAPHFFRTVTQSSGPSGPP
jgi:diacylglycerol kinase (ATP)